MYSENNVRAQIYERLGFDIPQEYAELAGDKTYFTLSLERLDLIDQDIVLWEADAPAPFEDLQVADFWKALDVNKAGIGVILSADTSLAFGFGGAQSIETVIDQIGDQLRQTSLID